MTNPLIEKFYELHPEKKEKPKVIEAENAKIEFYDKDTGESYGITDILKKYLSTNPSSITPVTSNITTPSVATTNTGITKASPIKCFDNPSGNDAFLQIAEKIKNGTALVKTVSAEVDHCGLFSYGKRITFEVYDYENP